MPDPKPGPPIGEIVIGAVVVGGLIYVVYSASQSGSSTSTNVAFSQPDPSSVAALASATADEAQANTNYLVGIAQNGANVATQLAADQTAIRTAAISSGTNEYDTYVTAGSSQNIAQVQSAGAEALALIQAGEQETVNQSSVTGALGIADTQAAAEQAQINAQESTAKSGQVWGAISNVLGSAASAITGAFTGGLSLFSGFGGGGGASNVTLPAGYSTTGYSPSNAAGLQLSGVPSIGSAGSVFPGLGSA